jgi:hypothetical protein
LEPPTNGKGCAAVNGELLAELEGRYSPVKGKLPAVRSPLERWRSNRWNEGGDKMSADRHGYADDYARLLARWDTPTLVEVGVFQGASLAIWCDLFPQDAYAPNVTALAEALDGRTIDVLVDDGPHTDVAVLSVYDAVALLLSPSFTYIVEDMPNGADLLATRTDGQFGQAGLLGWVET